MFIVKLCSSKKLISNFQIDYNELCKMMCNSLESTLQKAKKKHQITFCLNFIVLN